MHDAIQSMSSPGRVSRYRSDVLRRRLDDNGAWNFPRFLVRSANVFANCRGVAADSEGCVNDFQRKDIGAIRLAVWAEARLITWGKSRMIKNLSFFIICDLASLTMGKLNSGHFTFCATAFLRRDEISKSIWPLERSLNILQNLTNRDSLAWFV